MVPKKMRHRLLVTTVLGVTGWLCQPVTPQVFQGFPPANPPLTGSELVPADTGKTPPSVVISTNQLATYSVGLGGGGNWLIAGDAGQNLWQRGTTGPSVTTTVAFGPDRWAYWSGAATPMVVSEDVTSAITGFGAAYRMQRTAGATGVVQMCLAQEVSTENSLALQGRVVEVDLNTLIGANFSSTNMGLLLVSGTGVNEGVQKLAFGLNGGGGGSVGWTGQVNVVASTFTPLVQGVVGKPTIVGQMSGNVKEVGVVFCYNPSGTAGANDWLDLAGVQLRVAPSLVNYVSNYLSYPGLGLPFVWRLGNQEALLQIPYYQRLAEGVGPDAIGAGCVPGTATTEADCSFRFALPMNRVPDVSFVTGFSTNANSGGLTACTGLAVVAGTVITNRGVMIACTAAVNVKSASFLYENGGSGVIAANAEWN